MGYHGGGVPPFKSTPWESSRHGVGKALNHYFGCQIRDQRSRFTPGGFLLEEFLEKLDFFKLFKVLKWPASVQKNLSVIHFFPIFHFIHHILIELTALDQEQNTCSFKDFFS